MDYHSVPNTQGKAGSFTIFNIYIHGEYATSRRYSEFADLHKRLKLRFQWHKFPTFPGKKVNGLTGSTLGVSLWPGTSVSLRETRAASATTPICLNIVFPARNSPKSWSLVVSNCRNISPKVSEERLQGRKERIAAID